MTREKRERFYQAYLETGDARQAAEKAGYSPSYGAAFLKRPEVAARLQERAEAKAARSPAEEAAEEVLHFFAELMRGERCFPVYDKDGQCSWQTPPLKDRLHAAELLGKHYRLFSGEPLNSDPLELTVELLE